MKHVNCVHIQPKVDERTRKEDYNCRDNKWCFQLLDIITQTDHLFVGGNQRRGWIPGLSRTVPDGGGELWTTIEDYLYGDSMEMEEMGDEELKGSCSTRELGKSNQI